MNRWTPVKIQVLEIGLKNLAEGKISILKKFANLELVRDQKTLLGKFMKVSKLN